MKKILITGANSYVGTNVEKWLMKEPDKYYVETLDMKDSHWKEFYFSKFDVIFHVAGIVHQKETTKNKQIYYKINRDLTYETAKIAKKYGVKHFIYLSSMSVYGIHNGEINEYTKMNPKDAYGKSKLEAEILLKSLESDKFKISISRPPMIYGKGCKGNYQKLVRIALLTPVFPKINNRRSMIYITNLSEHIKDLIDECKEGVFFPQNYDFVNTSDMIKTIRYFHNKKLILTKLFFPLIFIFKNTKIIKKVFGDLIYDESISNKINTISFYNSIRESELNNE